MEFYLLHKNDIVFISDIDESGKLSKVKVANKDLLPIGAQMNMSKLVEWWADRAVPKTRKGCRVALERLGYASTANMLVDNLALSLNDCYWICPIDKKLYWEEISLFSNNFYDIFGSYTFEHFNENKERTRFVNATTQGELQKKWMINSNGDRVLVKGNYGNSCQQSLNEVFASLVHKKQGKIPYTEYRPIELKLENGENSLGCACKNFCSENIESISLWEMMQNIKNKPSENWFMKAYNVCVVKFGMSKDYFHRYLDYLIMTDYILSNTDRHMNNIAVLRDSNNLNILGFSPIYDTGNSMYFRNTSFPIGDLSNIKTHSFYEREADLLKLVKDRSLLDLSKVPSKEEFYKIYGLDKCEGSKYRSIYDAFVRKCSMLNDFQNGKNPWENRRKRHIIT